MRLLFLTHAFNSLAQRLWLELSARGHEISIEFDINDAVTREAVELWRPALVLAPFLKRAIADDVWRHTPCLVVHPGPPGDRGPSALDWAILQGRSQWGVTVLQAVAEMDAGPVWAWREFPLRPAPKSSLYRREVTEAAIDAVLEALERFVAGRGPVLPRNEGPEGGKPPMRQTDRAIDWALDDSSTILTKIHSADGQPGVRDRLDGRRVWLHDAVAALRLTGPPGRLIGRAGDAVARATRDGAVWIGHLKIDDPETGRRIKLPATTALERLGLPLPPEVDPEGAPNRVRYTAVGKVGVLRFPFLNGALSTARCQALQAAIRQAAIGPEAALVLTGGSEFWSNGLDLAGIEAADSPAEASLENIEAIDEVCRELIELTDKWVVSALCGNAGAGGVFLALAADELIAREGIVLNPHYQNMGNLYGSEYWTYLLPRRLGAEGAERLMATRLPLSVAEAVRMGLFDAVLPGGPETFEAAVIERTAQRVAAPDFPERLRVKVATRARDEAEKPLAAYRAEELERMRLNFFGFDTSYHVARFDFITKTPHSRTPLHLARHRRLPQSAEN